VLILLLGGGGYYGHSTYGGAGLGGVLGLVLVVAVVVWLVGWRLGYRLIDHLAEMSSMGRGIWARRVGDKEARNDPASHRATGGMVKVSSNRRTRRSHRPAPKKINRDGY
jgi:hypothetical protein